MDYDQRWTKDRGMRGRLPTFAAVVIYGLISSFASADVCRRLSTEPSHGENRGSSPLGSANYSKHLLKLLDVTPGSYGKYTEWLYRDGSEHARTTSRVMD
jgi:hypothetical protein